MDRKMAHQEGNYLATSCANSYGHYDRPKVYYFFGLTDEVCWSTGGNGGASGSLENEICQF